MKSLNMICVGAALGICIGSYMEAHTIIGKMIDIALAGCNFGLLLYWHSNKK